MGVRDVGRRGNKITAAYLPSGQWVRVGPGKSSSIPLAQFQKKILQTDLCISLKNDLREFVKRSRHFLLGDHFINSHNLISKNCCWSLLRLG